MERWVRADGTLVDVERFESLSGELLLTSRSPDGPVLRLDPANPTDVTDLELFQCDCNVTIDGTLLAIYTRPDGSRYMDEAPETLGYERLA